MSLNKRVADMSNDEPRYHMLRIALMMMDKPLAELSDAEYQQVAQQAYRELAIEQRALSSDEANSVIIPAAMVESAVKEIIERYESEGDFYKALEDNGLDIDHFYQCMERDLRVQTVIERISARGWRADDVDGEIFYLLHNQRFLVPETRTLRHILLTINDDYAENTREQVTKRITEIRERVLSKPKRFDEQAQKHSECPTAMNGGLLGKVSTGQLYPELEAVAFKLKAGEVSEPVETELGMHILYCEEINPKKLVAYHEVDKKIKDQLQQRYDRIWLRQWLKGQQGA